MRLCWQRFVDERASSVGVEHDDRLLSVSVAGSGPPAAASVSDEARSDAERGACVT